MAMYFLFAIAIVFVLTSALYYFARRSGYRDGRFDERKEWSTRIRDLND